MSVLVALADVRDVVVIVYGIIGIIFFFIALIMLMVVGFTVKGLIGSVRELLDESVKPTVDSIRGAADTVRGTTEFVGRTAVSPIVRTYGMAAGMKKGLGVLAGFNSRRKGK
ncbi:MAG: hypothetical protein GEU75_04425 [Dehalococcoidia bacterium]|nr:hypothetical protein [Dehalococcoidia bacterium]